MKEWFRKFAQTVSRHAGSWEAFTIAVLIVAIWFIAGFFVGFSNTFYQLLINTGTTIITFLMVFLIQNMQNRDAKVIHLKLDELIRVTKSARNHLVDLEDLSESELERLEKEFQQLREREDAKPKKAGKPSKE
jgi:low affinity Fe/Cu permease